MWSSDLDRGLPQKTWMLGATSNVLNDIPGANDSALPFTERGEGSMDAEI
jgi:hypothetical protein